jgi:hypothetical protein
MEEQDCRMQKAVWKRMLSFSSNGRRLRFLLRFNVSSELMDSLHEFEHFINMPGHFHSTPFFH